MLLYHGTKKGFTRGGLVLPPDVHGEEPRPGYQPGDTAYAYATSDRETAEWYALQAKGRGKPKILTVEPLGPIEPDPSVYDFERNQYRCAEGFVVVKVEMVDD